MMQQARGWLKQLPITDEVAHQQGRILQVVLIGWIMLTTLGALGITAFLLFNTPPDPRSDSSAASPMLGLFLLAALLLWISPLAAFMVLRRGQVQIAVAVAAFGILLAHVIATSLIGVFNATAALLFQIPLALAGLLGGRWLLFSIATLNIAIYVTIGILQIQTPPRAGFLATAQDLPVAPSFGFFVVVTLLLTILLDRTSMAHRQSIERGHDREADLRQIRASLEVRVAERTTALEQALHEVQTRAAEQANMLDQIERQEATIRNLSVPVIPIDDHTLVMPLVGELDTSRLIYLQTQGLAAIEATGARTLIVDITGVPIVDTQVAQGILQMMQSARLLGGEVLVVGIRPEVAQTIVGLGINLHDMRTFGSLQAALASIGQRRAAPR
jgi:rsbT co-antagonist protein RsbR